MPQISQFVSQFLNPKPLSNSWSGSGDVTEASEAPSERRILLRWKMEGRMEGGCCVRMRMTLMVLMKISMI